MTSRRLFIKQLSIASAATLLVPSLGYIPKPTNVVGLQLYTLRDLLPKNVKGTLEAIGKAGYKEVEVFDFSPKNGFWGTPVKEFKKLLSNNGLKAISGHYGASTYLISGKTDELNISIETAAQLNHNYLTIPWLDLSLRKDLDGYKRTAEKLNKIGEICKKSNLKLAYHNHDFEFLKHEGFTGYEILLKETDSYLVNFEMDLYWVAYSGYNPLDFFKQYPKRFPLWHVKDMSHANKTLNTEIGKGTINFKPIFKQAKAAGLDHFFVEQETNYYPDEIGSIQESFKYANKNLLSLL